MIPRRSLQIVVLALIILVAVGEIYQYRLFYHDDAFISLRYVRNFLNGDGLVWNAGERVEGYSNFLLVIIVAALGRLGIDLALAARIVGILSYLLLAAFVFRRSYCAHQRSGNDWLWLIPVIITTTALPLVIWSLGGLETTLFALLITIGAMLFADGLDNNNRPLVSAGLALGLASLCRPDGLLFVLVAFVTGLGAGLIAHRRFDRRLSGFLFGALALVVPHLIWRYTYYHGWLPNTYYVKAANPGGLLPYGLTYFKEYVLAFPFLPFLLVAGVIWGLINRAITTKLAWYGMTIVAYWGYVVAVGGDHMPAFRLLAPLVPLIGWLIFELVSLSPLMQRKSVDAVAVVFVFLLCAGQLLFPAEKIRRAQVMDGAALLGAEVGRYINANWPEGSVVALNTAGSTPYFAPKLRFIDMLGLNDSTIARRPNPPIRTEMQKWPGHGKGDGRYVLSRRPDYIIIGPSNGDYANDFPWFLSDYELEGSAEFERLYQPVRVVIPMTTSGYEWYTESSLGALRFIYYERRK
ncbi:MAG: hypothetical protein HY851_10420 [candidate division Zixibacteria bacterium]|nr:hypothetical protein [candidate division Zixibacteria bacterium]